MYTITALIFLLQGLCPVCLNEKAMDAGFPPVRLSEELSLSRDLCDVCRQAGPDTLLLQDRPYLPSIQVPKTGRGGGPVVPPRAPLRERHACLRFPRGGEEAACRKPIA